MATSGFAFAFETVVVFFLKYNPIRGARKST